MGEDRINNREDTLTIENIKDAFDVLYLRDFFATMGGWQVSPRRISAICGKEVGRKYKKWMDSL